MLVATVLPTAVCVIAAPTITSGLLKAIDPLASVFPIPKPSVEIPLLEKSIPLNIWSACESIVATLIPFA